MIKNLKKTNYKKKMMIIIKYFNIVVFDSDVKKRK